MANKYITNKLLIHISGRREGDCITFWVSDNGIGIDPRHQDRVFEMFHRLDPNCPVSGDGLGLTIASRILDRHQGRIRLESERFVVLADRLVDLAGVGTGEGQHFLHLATERRRPFCGPDIHQGSVNPAGRRCRK